MDDIARKICDYLNSANRNDDGLVQFLGPTISREFILDGASKLFLDSTDRGVLGAFPGVGGVAGQFVMKWLRGVAPANMSDSLLLELALGVLRFHKIPFDWIPSNMLFREGVALAVNFKAVAKRLADQLGIQQQLEIVTQFLNDTAEDLMVGGGTSEDAYLLTVESVNGNLVDLIDLASRVKI
jgi:hypothetical protein